MGPLAPYYDTEMSVAAKRALAEGTSVPSKRRRMADEVSVSSAGGAYVGNGNVRRGVGMIDYAVQEEPKIKVRH